jgi:hypothetical protein
VSPSRLAPVSRRRRRQPPGRADAVFSPTRVQIPRSISTSRAEEGVHVPVAPGTLFLSLCVAVRALWRERRKPLFLHFPRDAQLRGCRDLNGDLRPNLVM